MCCKTFGEFVSRANINQSALSDLVVREAGNKSRQGRFPRPGEYRSLVSDWCKNEDSLQRSDYRDVFFRVMGLPHEEIYKRLADTNRDMTRRKRVLPTRDMWVTTLTHYKSWRTYYDAKREGDENNSPYIVSSSACIKLKRWTHNVSYEHRTFLMDGELREIETYDEYVYRRQDEMEFIPENSYELRLPWRSAGILGDMKGCQGTDVTEDPERRTLATHKDYALFLYSVSQHQKSLISCINLYNDLNPRHLDLSIKAFENAQTAGLQIKVDFSAVPNTVFAWEPKAEYLLSNQTVGKEIEVHKEGSSVWCAYYAPKSETVKPGSRVRMSWQHL